ncbi:MAG: Na+/H+ antiporter NhaA [Hyphomonadaceae bacterium]|nr:Na+/H+ antiporter NhaA [Hyphomonadaceae bacterium]
MASTSANISWWARDTTPGFVLLAATALSFLILNGPLAGGFHHLLEDSFAQVALTGAPRGLNLHLVINDGLMAIFFLFVGLELKRETVEGPFKNPRDAALPLFGAVGGMIGPALIYLLIAGSNAEYQRGWAIPAATDIAFAIGVLSLLGKRVPAGLRLFLLALAIIDDLGAILVIALFYTTQIVGWALGGAILAFLALLALNRAGVRTLWPYWVIGAVLWSFMLLSGVHATIAGVLTAMAVPMRAKNGGSPLITAEHALKPWVALAIMPIFALANAGVSLVGVDATLLLHPVAVGVGLGLLLGKPVGIMLFTFAAAALLKRAPPAGLAPMAGVATIAGIGFTMSLFIGTLAFGAGDLATPLRFGVLGGSLLSALIGFTLLHLVLRKPEQGDQALAADEEMAERSGVLQDMDTADPR